MCVTYSPAEIHRISLPSNFWLWVKMHVRAGMLMPMAKVSVAKRHLMRPSEKRISMISLRMGRRPPWWMPMPRFRSGRMAVTWVSCLSSSLSESMALRKTCSTSWASSLRLRSMPSILRAYSSHSFLEKEKTMIGPQSRSMHTLMIFVSSALSPGFLRFFAPALPFPLPVSRIATAAASSGVACSVAMAFWKLSSRNTPFSSRTRCNPFPPLGKM